MYSTITSEYDRQFPTLERKMDPITGRTSKPFIHPSEVQPNGKLKPLTQAEEVLNWQSENMVSQNEILLNLDKKVDKIAEKRDETDEDLKVLSQKMQKHYKSLKAQVSQLDQDLWQMLEERAFGKTFDQKEREIRSLQSQVKDIDDFLRASHERKPKPVESPWKDHYESSKQKGDESLLDGDNISNPKSSSDETPRYFFQLKQNLKTTFSQDSS
ncbi:unnamed protein product [Lathyrus sativus]|nr:unnamed protein product [Lathyrus sativus]